MEYFNKTSIDDWRIVFDPRFSNRREDKFIRTLNYVSSWDSANVDFVWIISGPEGLVWKVAELSVDHFLYALPGLYKLLNEYWEISKFI